MHILGEHQVVGEKLTDQGKRSAERPKSCHLERRIGQGMSPTVGDPEPVRAAMKQHPSNNNLPRKNT